MKKWILRIVIALLTILFLLIGGILFLVGTQSGTNLIVTQTVKLMDGQLQIGSASGTLLDRLEVNNLLFESPAVGKIELEDFVLDWKSSDLFNLHFHILELQIADINYTASQEETEKTDSTGPTILPDLALPITITIEKLLVSNVNIRTTDKASPFIIDRIHLSASWDTAGIQLKDFSFSIPEAALLAKGKILPTGDYPLALSTEIKTLSLDLPSVTLNGEYEGDLKTLTIKEKLRGDIKADIQGTVEDVLNALAWNINFDIHHFAPGTFSPDVPGIITGKLVSTGTLQEVNTTIQIAMRDDKESYVNWDAILDADVNLDSFLATIKKCTLKHLDSAAVIELSGSANTEQQLDIALNWKSLQWPLTGDSDYNSPTGSIKLTGTVDDYQLTLITTVSGAAIPDSTLQLTSNGNTKSAHDIHLSLETLEGIIAVNGSAEWAPTVEWQIETTASNINPGVQYPEWPGTLNWAIKSNGHIEESGVFTDLFISSLQGDLRELPVTGSGNISVVPEHIQIAKLQLSSGDAKLTAQGLLGDASDLNWNIQIANFSDLLPESSGQLAASGTVLGKMPQAIVTANISGSSLVLPQLEIEELQLNTYLDLSWNKPFTVDLVLNNLQASGNLLSTVTLNANGKVNDHTLDLFVSHELADISLALQGDYKDEQWQGAVSTLALNSKDMGKWQSTKDVTIIASAKAATLAPLCLTREQSDLCISGAWDNENLQTGGKASLTKFPLNWLSAWFPETLDELGGAFSFNAEVNMQEKLQASAHAQITPGNIKYTTLKDTGTLLHEGLKLDLQVANDRLDADLCLSVNSNILNGNLHSPDLLQANADHSPAIDGTIKIDAKNFTLVETLIKDVENLNAQINTDFTITGTIAAPKINGKGKFHINNIFIPAAGLELSDTSLNILVDNSKMQLDGIFNSGKGSMVIDGNAFLSADENYPALITLKGENFRIVNLPEIQAYLSSDLTIERTKDLNILSGTVTIPRADILLRNLPKGTVTASPDIVIKQEQQEEEESKSPMQMDLRVSLGKKVYFAGFGVNAFIDGQLSIKAEPEEQMLGSGEFHIRQGSYRAYGQDLEIENGVISFPGGPLTQPGINLRAIRSIGDVVAGISVIGSVKKPRITTFSRPPMSESQTLSYIITGSSPSTGGAKLSVGRQINNKLSVSVGTDTKTGDSEFIARYRLGRKVHIETTTGSSSNAADIFYTTELGGKETTEENTPDKEQK